MSNARRNNGNTDQSLLKHGLNLLQDSATSGAAAFIGSTILNQILSTNINTKEVALVYAVGVFAYKATIARAVNILVIGGAGISGALGGGAIGFLKSNLGDVVSVGTNTSGGAAIGGSLALLTSLIALPFIQANASGLIGQWIANLDLVKDMVDYVPHETVGTIVKSALIGHSLFTATKMVTGIGNVVADQQQRPAPAQR